MSERPNVDEVERLTELLAETMRDRFGKYEPRDAMSAAMTFTYRLARTILTLTKKEDRAGQGEQLVQGFARTAALIAFETGQMVNEKVH